MNAAVHAPEAGRHTVLSAFSVSLALTSALALSLVAAFAIYVAKEK